MRPADESNRSRDFWLLDAGVDYLNHGSFGSCPRPVLDHQARLRLEMERSPVEWFIRRLPEPCPEGMLGSMASLPLPDASGSPPSSPLYSDQLQQALRERHRIEVPVIPWPKHPKRLLRISAQAYNHIDQYRRLAEALVDILMYTPGR